MFTLFHRFTAVHAGMSKGASSFRRRRRGRLESLAAAWPGNTSLANHERIGENRPAIRHKADSEPARGAATGISTRYAVRPCSVLLSQQSEVIS